MKIWVTTDWHLWSVEDRRHPYKGDTKLNEWYTKFCEKLNDDDVVLILGDLCDSQKADLKKLEEMIRNMPGYKMLCLGNHDELSKGQYLNMGFDSVSDGVVCDSILFTHKPVYVDEYVINIHGHLHTRMMVNDWSNRHINAYRADCMPTELNDLLTDATYRRADTNRVFDRADLKWTEKEFSTLDKEYISDIVDISEFVKNCVDGHPMDESTEEKEEPTEKLVIPVFEDIYKFSAWMKANIHYKNFDKLQKPVDTVRTKRGSCHDQVILEYQVLREMNYAPKILFFIEYADGDEVGGRTHTTIFCTNNNDKRDKSVYWFENAWSKEAGVKKFNSVDEIKDAIEKAHANEPEAQKYPNLEFKLVSPSKMVIGSDLRTLVGNIMNESVEYALTKGFDKYVTLYHGSPDKLKVIEPKSFNFGTKLSKPRMSSFWSTDKNMAIIWAIRRLPGISDDDTLQYDIDCKNVAINVQKDSYDKFVKYLKGKKIYIYVATLPTKHVGRGHIVDCNEYTFDDVIIPHHVETLSSNDITKLIVAVNNVSNTVIPPDVSSSNIVDRLVYHNRETINNKVELYQKDLDDAYEWGKTHYKNRNESSEAPVEDDAEEDDIDDVKNYFDTTDKYRVVNEGSGGRSPLYYISDCRYETSVASGQCLSPTIDSAVSMYCCNSKMAPCPNIAYVYDVLCDRDNIHFRNSDMYAGQYWCIEQLPLKYKGEIALVYTDDGTLTSWEWAEDVVNESVTKKDDYIEFNFSNWSIDTGHNALYITGLSGSGKTTLGNKLAAQYNATYINLDHFMSVCRKGSKHLAKRITDGNWTDIDIYIRYFKEHPDGYIPGGDTKTSLSDINRDIVGKYYLKFSEWFKHLIHTPEYSRTLFVVEGVHIYEFESAELYRDEPVIVMSAGTIKALFRRERRGIGRIKEKKPDVGAIELILGTIKDSVTFAIPMYLKQEHVINKFRSDMMSISESVNLFKKIPLSTANSIASTCVSKLTTYVKQYKDPKLKPKFIGFTDNNKTIMIELLGAGIEQYTRESYSDKLKELCKKLKEDSALSKFDEIKSFDNGDGDEGCIYINLKHPIQKDSGKVDESAYTFELADKYEKLFFPDPINEASSDTKLYPVYIMLMHSGTTLANLIKKVTKSNFSHSSISFDSSMTKMYSFGRKFDSNPFIGTFKSENIRTKFFEGKDIPYALYMVPATKTEIDAMKRRLEFFTKNATKFKYDFVGLFKNYFGIADNPEYRYFCSRFVADIINAGRPAEKPYVVEPSLMKPEDFAHTTFAQYVTGGSLDMYDPIAVDGITKRMLREEEIRRIMLRKVDESVTRNLLNSYATSAMLAYECSIMDEAAFDKFIDYIKSFKVKFNKNGDVIITRREYENLEHHFKQSLKTIKAMESAGNVEGVKIELCKIHYMNNLISEHYLTAKYKQPANSSIDIRKRMIDLRSVMLNAFKQHLTYVTVREPRFNFQEYYNNSDYGKNFTVPKNVVSNIGKTIVTLLK